MKEKVTPLMALLSMILAGLCIIWALQREHIHKQDIKAIDSLTRANSVRKVTDFSDSIKYDTLHSEIVNTLGK